MNSSKPTNSIDTSKKPYNTTLRPIRTNIPSGRGATFSISREAGFNQAALIRIYSNKQLIAEHFLTANPKPSPPFSIPADNITRTVDVFGYYSKSGSEYIESPEGKSLHGDSTCIIIGFDDAGSDDSRDNDYNDCIIRIDLH